SSVVPRPGRGDHRWQRARGRRRMEPDKGRRRADGGPLITLTNRRRRPIIGGNYIRRFSRRRPADSALVMVWTLATEILGFSIASVFPEPKCRVSSALRSIRGQQRLLRQSIAVLCLALEGGDPNVEKDSQLRFHSCRNLDFLVEQLGAGFVGENGQA